MDAAGLWLQSAADAAIAPAVMQAIVFCNNAEVAAALTDHLSALGVPTVHVSARLPQPTRLAALAALRSLAARVAVSSDVFARGIDLEYVNLVVNFDLPRDGETYAHRLGRAGRYGAAAIAVTVVAGGGELGVLGEWAGSCGCGAPPVSPPGRLPSVAPPISAPQTQQFKQFKPTRAVGSIGSTSD